MRIDKSKFFGKSITKVIKNDDGEEIGFIFNSLKGKDMDLFLGMQNANDTETQKRAMEILFNKVVKDNIPDATDEDIKNFSLNFFLQAIEGIMEVNGLSDKDTEELKRKYGQR